MSVAQELARHPDSVGAARRLVEIHGVDLSADQRDDAALMASELVTNALIHGSGAITISIAAGPHDFTVEIADQGAGPVAIRLTPGPSGGYGLRIVDDLADAWGSSQGSTRVWFCLLIPPAG